MHTYALAQTGGQGVVALRVAAASAARSATAVRPEGE